MKWGAWWRGTVGSAFVFASGAVSAVAQVPAGPLLRVADEGLAADVASGRQGNFMAVWTTQVDSLDVMARIYDSAGTAVGVAFRVNTYTTDSQGGPRVAVDASDRFLVVWSDWRQAIAGQPDGAYSVHAQRLDSTGRPLGGEFTIAATTGNESAASVAAEPDGTFTVAWQSEPGGGGPTSIKTQRFASDGSPLGSVLTVNSGAAAASDPSVSLDGLGRATIAWSTQGIDGRRLDATGVPVGAEYRISATGAGAHVSSRTDGLTVVVWSEQSGTAMGRLYDSSGEAVDVPFVVAEGTPSLRYFARDVDWEGAAGFVVGLDAGRDVTGSPFGVGHAARRFDRSGNPRGEIFMTVPGFWDGSEGTATSSDQNGNFVIVSVPLYATIAQRYGGLTAAPATVDARSSATSDGNGVLEPGEAAEVAPFWRNVNGAAQTFVGSVVDFDGPAGPGVSYTVHDAAGSYGTVPNGTTTRCADCYGVEVGFAGTRPSTHWDAMFEERLAPDTLGQDARWPLHLGSSFTDVPKTSPYYRFIETVLHKEVTTGCDAERYCPRAAVSREQMAVFVLAAREGSLYRPPACTLPAFDDVPATSPTCRFVEELLRRGVTAGCGGGRFCPAQEVTREAMAVFLLRTLDPSGAPPACAAPPFTDVPVTSAYCRWIAELLRRGVANGCGSGKFCGADPVTREQMAVFLSQAFGLHLYGP